MPLTMLKGFIIVYYYTPNDKTTVYEVYTKCHSNVGTAFVPVTGLSLWGAVVSVGLVGTLYTAIVSFYFDTQTTCTLAYMSKRIAGIIRMTTTVIC